jgi:DNA (cytosine-5)-methyltransferase 1
MKKPGFTFIDLFAGIGGFRIGLDRCGGRCLFSCEWDRFAQQTYEAWYGEKPAGDIRAITPADIPDHDILAGGFPCQPFSIAGVSKKKSLGREHGFRDQTQGTLFFHIAAITEAKRPRVLLLENVKNLLSHDKGRTWAVILDTLKKLEYQIFHKIIDARPWTPQHRERIFIAAFDQRHFPVPPAFSFPEAPPPPHPVMRDILLPETEARYVLSDKLWGYLQEYARKHKAKGNGFGYGISPPDGIARTLSARYYKDGSEILIARGNGRNPRRLTPRECARLMGFPDDLPIVVSDTQAYKQFGNALVPPVAEAIGRCIVPLL